MLYNQPVGGAANDPYVTGNPATATPGSIPPGASIEYPQREIVNAITASGIVPSNGDLYQLAKAIQSDGMCTSVATGISDVFAGVFNPPITVINTPIVLYVRALAANLTTTPVFTPASGVITAAVIVKGNNLPLAVGDIAGAGHWICLQWDPTLGKWILQNPASGINSISAAALQQTGISGQVSNFLATAIGINNLNCNFSGTEAVLENGAGLYMVVRNFNKTVNANGVVGAPLSIAVARAVNTWYYGYLWFNAANGLTATLDPSPTAPSAPIGYASADYHCKLPGANFADSSAGKYLAQINTSGKDSWYVVLAGSNTSNLPLNASGTLGMIATPIYAAIGIANVVPPTAKAIVITHSDAVDAQVIIAPNNQYGGWASTTNPAPIQSGASGNYFCGSNGAKMQLESAYIYAASNAATYIFTMGWSE